MSERGNERPMVAPSLVPPAVLGGEGSGDEDLVHWRVQFYPWIALRERLCVLGNVRGPVGILKISNPIGNSEVAQIGDWCNFEVAQPVECFVGKAPVVAAGADVGSIIGRAVPEKLDLHCLHQLEVLGPPFVVAALFEFVDTFRLGLG